MLETAQIAERLDVAIMSTKGMSTTAAREMLDRAAPDIQQVLVLHDFDVSGFSIFGTLASDDGRYRFKHTVPILSLIHISEWINNTVCIDTGCVFGGKLTALRYPEREFVDVPAARVYIEPARPLGVIVKAGGGPTGQQLSLIHI